MYLLYSILLAPHYLVLFLITSQNSPFSSVLEWMSTLSAFPTFTADMIASISGNSNFG